MVLKLWWEDLLYTSYDEETYCMPVYDGPIVCQLSVGRNRETNKHIGVYMILNGKGGLTGCGLTGQSNIAGCFLVFTLSLCIYFSCLYSLTTIHYYFTTRRLNCPMHWISHSISLKRIWQQFVDDAIKLRLRIEYKLCKLIYKQNDGQHSVCS